MKKKKKKKQTGEQNFHLRELKIKLICKERVDHVVDDVKNMMKINTVLSSLHWV